MKEVRQIIRWSQHNAIILIKPAIWGRLLHTGTTEKLFKIISRSFTRTLCVKYEHPQLIGEETETQWGDAISPRSPYLVTGVGGGYGCSSVLHTTSLIINALSSLMICIITEACWIDEKTDGTGEGPGSGLKKSRWVWHYLGRTGIYIWGTMWCWVGVGARGGETIGLGSDVVRWSISHWSGLDSILQSPSYRRPKL